MHCHLMSKVQLVGMALEQPRVATRTKAAPIFFPCPAPLHPLKKLKSNCSPKLACIIYIYVYISIWLASVGLNDNFTDKYSSLWKKWRGGGF